MALEQLVLHRLMTAVPVARFPVVAWEQVVEARADRTELVAVVHPA